MVNASRCLEPTLTAKRRAQFNRRMGQSLLMRVRFVVALLGIGGCGGRWPDSPAEVTARNITCSASEITVSDVASEDSKRTWIARCRGTSFACTQEHHRNVGLFFIGSLIAEWNTDSCKRSEPAPAAKGSDSALVVGSVCTFRVPLGWRRGEDEHGRTVAGPVGKAMPLATLSSTPISSTLGAFVATEYPTQAIRWVSLDGAPAVFAVEMGTVGGAQARLATMIALRNGRTCELTCADTLTSETSEVCKLVVTSLRFRK